MATKLVVVGAGGRMGRRIVALAVESKRFDIVGAIDKADHPDIGRDAGALAGIEKLNLPLCAAWPGSAQVAIDFSLPEATEETAGHCAAAGIPLVMGTTGLTPAQQEPLRTAAHKVPVVYSTNMSIGMNALFVLVAKAAAMLGEDYDIEIVEEHHRFKKDAPSGSAMTLAQSICKATGRPFPDCLVHGRSGKEALRKKGEIGMHAVRAGDITGVHSVIYGSLGETITLNHTAHSRDVFVRGALRAAEWLQGKPPALYSMADVLGIQ
ncbi:MAG TPA: 4-hydroxy-tetrahydrodipicolinate reductase [Sedimentisphaerales bacterium]|jgi:4-hydroxy-tetrahydrodipicolinate reductase|nr:4-hydroxy-tetrahydrodipicolinate reductase [Sedimentisphaerales bacterium]HNU27650.1 4-hydroxy-tetrahydrodipicolinate reductase [Sedimentisphaerales bacterium]